MKNEENAKPHLILNFDINKTIILRDKSKNLDVESGVKSCLVDYAWGVFDEILRKWSLTENYLTHKKPKENLVNYYYYIKTLYPLKTKEEIPDKEERFKKNEEIKKIKDNLFLTFIDKGQPGENLNNHYLEILYKLKLSEKIVREINRENSKYPSLFKTLFENNYIYMFYSFFHLMIELQRKNRSFANIFRTFGYDFDDVIKEFNSFCEGNHPAFTGENEKRPKIFFDGTNGSKDYKIRENNKGVIYRFDEDINNIFLVLGTLERINVKHIEELFTFYDELIDQRKIKIIRGGTNIFKFINENSLNGKINSFCLIDDYEAWYKYDKNSICGKPILIDPENKDIKVFCFDDNIENGNKSIVDCRNAINGDVIESKIIKNKYLIMTDTLKAAQEENYFLDLIENDEK